MKKTYALFLLLTAMLFGWTSPTLAQDEDLIVFPVNAKSGDWTSANPARTWANSWASNGDEPKVTLENAGKYNNMAFYNGTDIQFYSGIGVAISPQTYIIKCSTGYKIKTISFDFVASNESGISVALLAGDPVENRSLTEPEHVEADNIGESEVSFVVATLGSANYFANTSNFFITIEPLSPLDKAWAVFHEVLNDYGTLTEEEFPVGDLPGLYGEQERTAFFEAVQAGFATEDMEDVSVELLEQLGKGITDAYQTLLDSKVLTYSVPSGYYRIRTAMVYSNNVDTGRVDADGNAITELREVDKYMLGYQADGTLYAIWGNLNLENTESLARSIWKIDNLEEQTENGICLYAIQSKFHDGRFNDVATSTAVTMAPESQNIMAIEPIMTTEEGATYVNIRVSTQEPGSIYLHQNSHASGSGTSGYVVGWDPSYTFKDGAGPSEWVLEPMDAEEAEKILADYAPIRERNAFEEMYAQLKANAITALNKAKDFIIGEGVITDADQLSSPYTETSEGSIAALIDGNASTYWHSDWNSGAVPNHTHYLQVYLGDGEYDLLQMTITRRPVAANHITLWSVYGSNDDEAADEDWVKLATLETPFGDRNETISAAPFEAQGYKHLRFYIDGTTNDNGYGHVSEFQLYQVSVNPTSQYALMGDAAKNLETVLAELDGVEISQVTEEQGAALQAAYEAFMLKYVDPAQLREVIASVEGIADGIVVGKDPGYWKDAAVADDLKKTVAEARAYDEAGIYVAEQSNDLIQRLTKQGEAVRTAAIGVETGKWYRIRFGSEATFQEHGWDLVAGEAIVDADTDVETDEALWNKVITVADYLAEDDVNHVVAIDPDDVRPGENIFVDDEADIEDADLALFRFVAVGDSAFIIQNKATGLFLKAAGASGLVTLNVHPTLFSQSAIGYGQNLIAARDLQGNAQNYLHVQRLYNTIVTWDATTPGSRSGLYIEEVADVDANYDGTEFALDITPGQIYTFCYPVSLSADDEDGQFYTVNQAEGTTVTLAPIQEVFAGRPVIYIYGEREDYDAEGEAMTLTFHHGYEVAAEPDNSHALQGTYTAIAEIGAGYIIVDRFSPNAFSVSRNLLGGSVDANTAYIAAEDKVPVGSDIEIVIDETTQDGIQTAIANLTRTGIIYTIDGRVVSRNGNLNTISKLPKGIYILNGTKVTVK